MMNPALILIVRLLAPTGQDTAPTPSDRPERTESLTLPPHIQQVLEEHALLPPRLRHLVRQSVVTTVQRWAPGSVLRVCFQEGSDELIARIARIAVQWNKVGNIELDLGNVRSPRRCEPGDRADVRVGYRYAGYWSVVGRESQVIANLSYTTLNLEGFHVAPPGDEEFRRTVLHEFGHALGLEHEHQSPNSTCAQELSWDAAYAYYARSPNNWTREQTDFNLRPLLDATVEAGEYDPDSIMHYELPSRLFLDPATAKCKTGYNTKISKKDEQGLAAAYPRPLRAAAALAVALRHLSQDIEGARSRPANEREELDVLHDALEDELASLERQIK